MTDIISQPPRRRAAADFAASCGEIAHQIARDCALNDSLMDALESRVIALEAVAAARWPARLAAAARLGRQIRASIRPYAGSSFAVRRAEATTDAWLGDHPAGPGRPGTTPRPPG